jgi:hypothetical protein
MVFAKPKRLKKLRRRDRRYKQFKRRTERYHGYLTDLAYVEYYEGKKA